MASSSSSDMEDEVFFGPILAKETKKASKLRRATQLFLPNFRENLDTSSDSSQCQHEDTASMSDEVIEATDTSHVTEAGYVSEAGHVTEPCLEQLTPSQTKRISKAGNVTKQEVGSLAHQQQIVKNLKETVPSYPTPSSPLPKIMELTKNENNDRLEQEESPFQKKSKALLHLIHRAREDWSSPTRSPSNVSISESGSSSAMKRKHISTSLHELSSPVLKKITKAFSDTDAVQSHKGDACNHDRETKFPSAPKVANDNISLCSEGSSPDIQTLESQPKVGCLKNINKNLKEYTAAATADRSDDDRSDLREDDEIRQSLNLKEIKSTNTIKVSEKQNINSYQEEINDGHGKHVEEGKDCTMLVSAFSSLVQHKPSTSDSSLHTVNESLTNNSGLGGHGMFRVVGDLDSQSDLFLNKQHTKFQNKENLEEKCDQPDYEMVSQDKQDALVEKDVGNVPKKVMSSAMQAFHDCSNLMVGYPDRHGDRLISLSINDRYINPEHTISGNYSQGAITPGTSVDMAKTLQVDSSMSLRRKVLEEKKAQLMKLKQAKEDLKNQLLQVEHKQQCNQHMETAQALQSNVPSFETFRPTVTTETSPTRTLDETSFDELTRYYTWKNSQLLLEENSPLNSHEQCSVKPEKPHLRWTDNLIIEVTELSSPRGGPSQKGKSILSDCVIWSTHHHDYAHQKEG